MAQLQHTTLLLLVFINGLNVVSSNYTVTDLKEQVFSGWSLNHFATLVREAVLSAVPFPWETVEQVLGSSEDIGPFELGQQLLTNELPLLVPACLGLLLAVLVPIVALFCCCCRCCCGCCGSKLRTEDVRNHSLWSMAINAFVVITMVGILSAMACCIPLSGNRLKTSPRLILTTVNSSLEDIPAFLDKFINDAPNVAMNALNSSIDDVKARLDDFPDILEDSVINGTDPYFTQIENKINIISNGIDNLEVTETKINNTVDALLVHSANLQSGISAINNLYVTIKSDCYDDGMTFCDTLPDGNGTDALNISIDNSKVTELAGEISKVVLEARTVNLTEFRTLGNTTFDEIPDTVRNASKDAIDEVKSTLDSLHEEAEPTIDLVLESAAFELDLGDGLEPLDNAITAFEENHQIVGIVFTAFACVLGIIPLTAVIGLLLGVLFTKKPTTLMNTGRTGAGHCGASLLKISVGLAVLPLFLVLVVGSLLMLLGGNFTVLCAPLQDLTMFSKVVDSGLLFGGENLGEMIFNDSSLNLSVTNLFRTCRKNGSVFSGLNLDSVVNFSTIFNVSSLVPVLDDDVVDQINDTVRDISITNTSLFSDLVAKLNLNNIDIAATSDIETELNGLDLQAKAQEIDDLADTLPDSSYADRYRAVGLELRNLHANTKVPLHESINNLTSMVDGLNSTSQNIKATITLMATDLEDLSNYVRTHAVAVIVQALNDFMAGMSGTQDRLIDDTLNAMEEDEKATATSTDPDQPATTCHLLRNDVGHCKVIAEVYDTVIASFCVHFLDSFNVLWASFYTGGLVCVVLMVASCRLSKYFRKPDDLAQVHERVIGNYSVNANPLGGAADVVLTKYTSFGYGNCNNSAVPPPKQNYRRIHQKMKQKRKFITGPFSAQFFGQDSTKRKQMLSDITIFSDSSNGNLDRFKHTDSRFKSDTSIGIESSEVCSISHSSCSNRSVRSMDGIEYQEAATQSETCKSTELKMHLKQVESSSTHSNVKESNGRIKDICSSRNIEDSTANMGDGPGKIKDSTGTIKDRIRKINDGARSVKDTTGNVNDGTGQVKNTSIEITQNGNCFKSVKEYQAHENHIKTFKPESNVHHSIEKISFPYLQLAGDEFILLPVTNLTTESYECNESEMEERSSSPKQQDTIWPNSHTGEWLQNYKIGQECNNAREYSVECKSTAGDEQDFENVKQNPDLEHGREEKDLKLTDGDFLGQDEYVTDKYIRNTKDNGIDFSKVLHMRPAADGLGLGNGQIDLVNRDTNDDFPLHRVVCSLCRNHARKHNEEMNKPLDVNPGGTTQGVCSTGLSRSDENLENISDRPSRFKESMSHNNIGIISKSLENCLHTFDDTLENMKDVRVDTCKLKEDTLNSTEQELCKSLEQKYLYNGDHYKQENLEYGDSHELSTRMKPRRVSRSKLDVKVKPYKPLKRMKSPRSAFLFWKYVEAHSNGSEGEGGSLPQEKPSHCNGNQMATESNTATYACDDIGQPCPDKTTYLIHHIENKIGNKTENTNNGEIDTAFLKKKVNGQKAVTDKKQPHALQHLAVVAGKLAHVREGVSKGESELESHQIDAQIQGNTRPNSNSQPQSLASLATSVSVSAYLANQLPAQDRRIDAACTMINNTKVSYL